MSQVLTITPAPALDVTISADSLKSGLSHRIAPATYRLGGKGLNVANVLAQQGFSATAMGLIAVDDCAKYGGNGYAPHKRIAELDPKLTRRFTNTELSLRSTWSIYSQADKDTAMFNEPARNFSRDEWEALKTDVLAAAHEDSQTIVAVSGSVPADLDTSFFPGLLAELRQGGAELIIDTQGETLLQMCQLHPLWVKPNHHEIHEALGHTDTLRGAHELLELGATNVAVSLGSEGLLLVTPERSVRARLDKPLEGNPTGAGDSVVAALAAATLSDDDLQATARRCVAWSGAAVLAPVAGEVSPQWEQLADTVVIEDVSR